MRYHGRAQLLVKRCIVGAGRHRLYRRICTICQLGINVYQVRWILIDVRAVGDLIRRDCIFARFRCGCSVFDGGINVDRLDRNRLVAVDENVEVTELLREIPERAGLDLPETFFWRVIRIGEMNALTVLR